MILHLNSFKMRSVFEALRMHFTSPRGIIPARQGDSWCERVSLYLKL